MRKLFLSIMLFMVAFALVAQPTRRVPKTIVADVLAQMPSQNIESFTTLMGDLASIPAEAVEMLTAMKTPIGVSDNSKIDFALGGLTSYITTPEGKGAREAVCKAYIKALDNCKEWEVRAFIVRQLEKAGADESIEKLQELCSSDDLYVQAAHALQYIGTDRAMSALLGSIDAIAAKSKAAAAKLIGDNKFTGFESQLTSWLGSGDAKQEKATIYALGEVGTSASLKLLSSKASSLGYEYDASGVLDAYMRLLSRVEGGEKTAIKLVKSAPSPLAQRKAISIVIDKLGRDALPYVIAAVEGSCPVYRVLALKEFTPYADASAYAQLVRSATEPRAKADILIWPNDNRGQALSLAVQSVDSRDPYLSEAALKYLSADGGSSAVEAICSLFTVAGGDVELASFYLNMAQAKIAAPTLTVFDAATEGGKKEIIKLWKARRISEAASVVKGYIGGSSSEFDALAREAMTTISTPNDLPFLYDLLAKGSSLELTQEAIVNALNFYCQDKRYAVIKSQMDSDPTNRVSYYEILAGINCPDAINVINSALASDNKAHRDAAAQALASWRGIEALDALYTVASDSKFSSYSDKAVAKYVELVDANKAFTDQTKYLHLRKVAEITSSDANINMILGRMSRYSSFGAMLFAGQYMDKAATGQAACGAVLSIASANRDFYGPEVEALINKFISLRKGGDAGYEIASATDLLKDMPKEDGYVSMFNGKDLSGWKGLVENPIARAKMSAKELAAKQATADEAMRNDWIVKDGILYFVGDGFKNLCSEKKYGNFEMYVDWKIEPHGDAGIYLRGTPQVQIWDTTLVRVGAQVGSGGLYNNQVNPSKPLELADGKIGDWNTLYIKMVGERVTVLLNGVKVVDNTILENYWDRSQPIFPVEQLELQAHGTLVGYRDIYVRELPETKSYELSSEEKSEGFSSLFDGVSMSQWRGNTQDYVAEDGCIALYPANNYGGNLYTKKEYSNFVLRFEFQLTEGANNGLGIRTPLEGDAAYAGMELQILDNEADIYKDLAIYQYHGSVYGVLPAKRGFLKPVGEWNCQEVIANGNHITVTLNGEVILDGDINEASNGGKNTLDKLNHPGLLNKSGHIAFLGHGSEVKFRNIRVKEL